MLLRLLLFLACFATAIAQTIPLVTVIDRESGEPIENVFVYGKDHAEHTVTSAEGLADLSLIDNEGTIYFQHLAYRKRALTKGEIDALGYVVKLESRSYLAPEVVISASKRQEALASVPQTIAPITPEEIAFENPQTTADAIARTNGVFMQKSQLGGGSPMIRGFAANSLLIVLDGVRMNNAIYRSGNLQNVINVDANELGRAEILFGPGSVTYGSDAMGGAMVFSSLPAIPSYNNQLTCSGSAMTRFASANTEKTTSLSVNLGYERIGSRTSVTYSDFDDLRAGGNRPDDYPDYGKRPWYVTRGDGEDIVTPNDNQNVLAQSGYSQFNLLQKLRYAGDDWSADYALHYSTSSNIPRYDRLIEERNDQPRSAQWYYGPQDWISNSVTLNKVFERGIASEANVILAHQFVEESRHSRSFNDDELTNRTEAVNVYSVNADLEKALSPRRTLTYGAEFVYNDVTSEANAENIVTGEVGPASTRYPDGGSQVTTIAGYAGHHWDVSSEWNFTSGIRYSQNMLHSNFDDTSYYHFPFDEIDLNNGALTASLGAVLMPGGGWRLHSSLASGFRAPNVDDAAKVFDSEPGSVIVPNPELSSEYAYSGEFGISKSFAESSITVHALGWYTRLTDAMVRRDYSFNGQDSIMYDGTLSRVQAVVNAGKAYLAGGEMRIDARLATDWRFRTGATYTAGRDLDEDVPMRHVPPLYGSAALDYEGRKLSAEGEVVWNAWKNFYDLSPSEQDKPHLYTVDGTPAWWVLNLRAAYRVTSTTTVNAALENIFDLHYRPFSSGISAPGRNVVVSVRQAF